MKRFALLFALGLTGCPDDVTITPPVVGDPGAARRPTPIQGPRRPAFVEAFRFDYAALPALAPSGAVPKDERVSLELDPSGVHADKDLVIEVDSGQARSFSAAPWTVVATNDLNGGTRFPPLVCSPAGSGGRGEPVKWDGLKVSTRSAKAIDFVHYEGFLDRASCKATATQKATVRAPAILEGVLYAFRSCVENCALPPSDPKRVEYLVVIGPHADWVGSSVPWNDLQTQPHVGPFSRLYVPVRPGASASISLSVSEANLKSFAVGARGEEPLHGLDKVELTLDLVWPGLDPGPSGSGRISFVEKSPAEQPQPSFPPPG